MEHQDPEKLKGLLRLYRQELNDINTISSGMESNSFYAWLCGVAAQNAKYSIDLTLEGLAYVNKSYEPLNKAYKQTNKLIESVNELKDYGFEDSNDVTRHLLNIHSLLEKEKDIKNLGKVAKGIVEANDGEHRKAIQNVLSYTKEGELISKFDKLRLGFEESKKNAADIEETQGNLRNMIQKRRMELQQNIRETEQQLYDFHDSGALVNMPLTDVHPALHRLRGILTEIQQNIAEVRQNLST
jgi:hypothetical protein